MSIKDKEYYYGVTSFKTPTEVTDKAAIGTRLMELIMMEPGDNPLHPAMGVGLNSYRYGLENLGDLKSRIQDQINTYLPFYQNAEVTLIRTDKIVNIEISIGDMVYIYDSSNAAKPITLSDLT